MIINQSEACVHSQFALTFSGPSSEYPLLALLSDLMSRMLGKWGITMADGEPR